MLTLHKWIEVFSGIGINQISRDTAFQPDEASEETTESNEGDTSLGDAARSEREYVRQRLREELKREPTELELDEWLRQHTEGY
jgi:hypothetical protein